MSLDSRWYEVQNFHDLIILNSEFVEGKLKETPYHSGPIESDDSVFKSKLYRLHQYGLLTHDGQDTECVYGEYIPQTWVNRQGQQEGKWWVDEERRGYLSFYIDLEQNKKLYKKMLKGLRKSNLLYTSYNFKNNETITNFRESVNLTRDRVHKDKNLLDKQIWHLYTNMQPMHDPNRLLWPFIPEINEILKKCAHFDIALPDYCKGDLEKQLIEICQNSGAKKYGLIW